MTLRFVILILSTGASLLFGCVETEIPREVGTSFAATTEVVVPGDDLDLVGTLHMPSHSEIELVPAVVLVHGSGPQGRDETMAGQLNMAFPVPISLFVELADRLQSDGLAVLRYDKRTCGPFNGLCDNDYPFPPDDVGVDHYVQDAVRAARWLAEQGGVDPERVLVVGHSQGGGMVPRMLTEAPELAAGISLAGNWRPIDALLAYQLSFSVELLESLGYSQQQIDTVVGDLRTMVEELAELRAGTFTGASIGGASVAHWQAWLDLDDARPADLAALDRPILAVNGGMDWNVPEDPELLGWEAALDANGAAGDGNAALSLPCLTHAFNCVEGQVVGESVDSSLLDGLRDWLDGRGLRASVPR